MKAIVCRRYGPPDFLTLEEIPKPAPADDQVLVAVRAASINPIDWHFMRGEPHVVRLVAGLPKPRNTRLGFDVAGSVEAVGRNVTRFKPGDDVFGAGRGAFAEYVCAPASSLAAKPARATFEHAAAVPVAGLTALEGLRAGGPVRPGQRVLINGASGGVGTFAVQIARSAGADVTAVCSTKNLDQVRSIGARRAIDYTREDFTQGSAQYDLILDCAATRPFSACFRVLAPGGTYAVVGAPGSRGMTRFIFRLLAGVVQSRFSGKKLKVVRPKASHENLAALGELLQAGKIVPVLDRCYPLRETAEAIRYVEGMHARGKVVVTVAPASG